MTTDKSAPLFRRNIELTLKHNDPTSGGAEAHWLKSRHESEQGALPSWPSVFSADLQNRVSEVGKEEYSTDIMDRQLDTADGRFFVAKPSLGIYCRPVCRVRPSDEHSAQLLPSAAAAEGRGFRPCLECQPESGPFLPAWRGTQSTVDRAYRLIEAGALDHGSPADLAERLGVTERQLERLFDVHLGAGIEQVAMTHRLKRAKRLLSDNQRLSLSQIALQAGFPSVERLQSAFESLHGRPLSEFRTQPEPTIEPEDDFDDDTSRFSALSLNVTDLLLVPQY